MANREETSYIITFRVDVRSERGYGSTGSLSITEDIQVTGRGLFELAGVLHQVHDLAEKIRDEQAGLTSKDGGR